MHKCIQFIEKYRNAVCVLQENEGEQHLKKKTHIKKKKKGINSNFVVNLNY